VVTKISPEEDLDFKYQIKGMRRVFGGKGEWNTIKAKYKTLIK
jgi:hypothetical protein